MDKLLSISKIHHVQTSNQCWNDQNNGNRVIPFIIIFIVKEITNIRIVNISLDIPMERYGDLTDAEIKRIKH
jgi:hypothetical protein